MIAQGALLGAGDGILQHAYGQTLTDAGALINFLVFAGGEGDALDDFADKFGNVELQAITPLPSFLGGDGDAFIDSGGIVGANLRADAVFERGDDLAASGVVLRIGSEDQRHVEGQAHGVAFNLHVAFLHDVEQAHLDFSRQIGQLVDGEDAAIGAGQQAVVHGELAA